MEGLWLEDNTLRYRADLPCPEPGEGESLVRLISTGICSTDIGLTHGLYPFTGVIGHEFVGVVQRGPEALINRRVVGEINIYCHTCDYCLKGNHKHCANRRVLGIRDHHGAFAEYLVLPNENLHLVPDTVMNDDAVFAEPLAASLDVLDRAPVGPSDSVLIVGDGRMGQLIARVLATKTELLTLIGKHASKLERLPPLVTACLDSAKLDARSFDIVVECTGNESGFRIALEKVRVQGTIILKSTYPEALKLDASRIVVDELKVVGSRCGDIKKALNFMAAGKAQLGSLIDARYPLNKGLEAFEASRSNLKVLVDFDK